MAWIEPSPKTHPNHRGPWNIRYRENGEKCWSGPFWVLSEARDEETRRTQQERQSRRSRSGHNAPETELKGLFKLYVQEEVLSNKLRESTAEQKERMLAPYLGRFYSLRDLTGTWGTDDWGQNIHGLKTALLTEPCPQSLKRGKRDKDEACLRPYSSSTASIILRALQTFLEWCKTKKYIPANPMEDFPMPKTKRRRDLLKGGRKDVELVLASAPNPIFALFLNFQIFQGLRKGMTRQVEGHEISQGMWTIPGPKAKVDHDITIPLHPRVQQKLAELFPDGLPRGPIFGPVMAGPKEQANSLIYCYWEQTRKKAALPYHITMHGLRRTWATEFMKHTQNLAALMAAGHWRDTKTAMMYQHIQAKWLKDQVDKFEYEE